MTQLTPAQIHTKANNSAISNPGAINNPAMLCQSHWIGIEARYDDNWDTSVSNVRVKATVNDGLVFDGPKTKGFSALGMEDGADNADPSHPLLGSYRHEGVPSGSVVCEIVGDPGVVEKIKTLEAQLNLKVKSMSSAIHAEVKPWRDPWEKASSTLDKIKLLNEAKNKGLTRGATAWKNDQVNFLKSLGNFFGNVWDEANEVADDYNDWYKDLSLIEQVLLPATLVKEAGHAAYEFGEDISQEAKELWEGREEILALFKAFASNSVNAVQKAIEALSKMGGEVGEIMKLLWKKGDDWVQALIEVCRETSVFKVIFAALGGLFLMIPPTLWVEGYNTAAGYIIPEILVSVILMIIAALSAGAGAAALAARIASYTNKIQTSIKKLGNIGPILLKIFDRIQGLADYIIDLVKLLWKKISEKVEGVVDRVIKIKRRVRNANSPLVDNALSGLRSRNPNGPTVITPGTRNVLAGDALPTRIFSNDGSLVPLGFNSADDFISFGDSLNRGFRNAGFDDVTPILQGSSVTGFKGFDKIRKGNVTKSAGTIFDSASDFDIALSSPQMLARAKELGIPVRSGTNTFPLNNRQLKQLKLFDLRNSLQTTTSRDVNFMIFNSINSVVNKNDAFSIFLPR